MAKQSDLIPLENISSKIYFIRNEKVLIDSDLAELYGVETKALKRAVRRNKDRFLNDFMFTLSRDEYNSLRSQFGTLKRGQHSKYLPYAFTEQCVAMLSSVLNSKRATKYLQFPRFFCIKKISQNIVCSFAPVCPFVSVIIDAE